jgi:hypothetical protein
MFSDIQTHRHVNLLFLLPTPFLGIVQVEREIQLALDCPEWLKTLIGHKTVRLRQRNTIDREARTLNTEAWNTTLEGMLLLLRIMGMPGWFCNSENHNDCR